MDRVRNPKLADAIADHLEQLILEGALRPGEKLAPERELAEKLAVSRPSLREALEKLAARQLIETTKAGTIVAQFLAPLTRPLAALLQSDTQVVSDYFEYRMMVEGEAARLAAERATSLDRDAIGACLAKIVAAHADDDPAPEAQADADFHMLIYEAAHNLVVLHVMRAFSEMLREDVFYNRMQLYQRAGVRDTLLSQHEAISAAILARQPQRAAEAAAMHISFTASTLREIFEEQSRVARATRRLGRKEIVVG